MGTGFRCHCLAADVVVGCCRLYYQNEHDNVPHPHLWVVIQKAVEELQSLLLLFTGTLEIPPQNH